MFPINFIYFIFTKANSMKNLAKNFTGRELTNEQARYRKTKTTTKSMHDIPRIYCLDTTQSIKCTSCKLVNPPQAAVAYVGSPVYKCISCFKLSTLTANCRTTH